MTGYFRRLLKLFYLSVLIYRCRYQGVSPPVKRTEDDFDPGALYDVAANIPIIKYLFIYIAYNITSMKYTTFMFLFQYPKWQI
jgi:hypothetical protein